MAVQLRIAGKSTYMSIYLETFAGQSRQYYRVISVVGGHYAGNGYWPGAIKNIDRYEGEDRNRAFQDFHDAEVGIETVKHVIVRRRLENQELYPPDGAEARREIDLGRDPIAARVIAEGREIQHHSWNSGLTDRIFEEYVIVPREWEAT
jgi:hypothetical protein